MEVWQPIRRPLLVCFFFQQSYFSGIRFIILVYQNTMQEIVIHLINFDTLKHSKII